MMRLNSFAINAPLSIWVQYSPLSDVSRDDSPFSVNSMKDKQDVAKQEEKSLGRINVPEVIEIDEEVYRKMYPKVFPVFQNLTKRIRQEYHDKTVDYDMDLEDQNWIKKDENISGDKFEEVIEFLETNSLHKVPSLEELQTREIVADQRVAEKIYDYWLDKRLRTKQKMMFDIKRATDRKKLTKKDFYRNPYVVFHQSNERMHTRKNRLKDNENYIEMLEHRKDLAQCHDFFKSLAGQAKLKHDELKLKLATFESLYQTRRITSQLYDRSRENPLTLVQDSATSFSRSAYPDAELIHEIDEVHDFTPQKDLKYWFPTNSESGVGWAAPDVEEHIKYYKVPNGLIRNRLGRGGRIICDRRFVRKRSWKADYKLYNVNKCYVKCTQLSTPFVSSPSSTSTFTLKNSCIERKNCVSSESFLIDEY